MNTHLDARVKFAKRGERGKQCVDGAFVDAEREFAALEAFEFGEAFLDLVTEVDKTLGVVPKKGAGVGQADGTGAANEERLAERVFEFAYGKTDGRLRAIEALRGTGEAAFFGNHQKNLQLTEIHISPLA